MQAALDRPVEVIYDVALTPSRAPRQRWETGRRAWEAHDLDADWHMVIQDDAVPCRDLIAGLEAALAVLGTQGLVSAYTGTGRPDQQHVKRALAAAAAKGHSWMPRPSLLWGVAIIAPVSTIPDMLAWCSTPQRSRLAYDMRIGRYYVGVQRWRTWYTVPSLVTHRDTASLIGHGSGGDRRAHGFHEGSALDIDWTRTPPCGLQHTLRR